MKHQGGSLFKNKGAGKKREHLGTIALKNTMTGGKSRRLDKTFDFLLVTDIKAAGIIDFDLLNKSSHATDHQIVTTKDFSIDRVNFIVEPCEVDVRSVSLPSFRDDLRGLQASHIDRLKEIWPRQKSELF